MRVFKLAGLIIAASVLSGCATLDGLGGTSASPDQAYLKTSARLPGTVVMPGVQYRVLKSGPATGVHPKLSDDVTVHYEGRLVNGEVFDSSFKRGAPSTFPLKKLIPGWEVAVRMMRPGDEWEIVIPSDMAYGSLVRGPIPANSTLIFRIQLISAQAPAPEGKPEAKPEAKPAAKK